MKAKVILSLIFLNISFNFFAQDYTIQWSEFQKSDKRLHSIIPTGNGDDFYTLYQEKNNFGSLLKASMDITQFTNTNAKDPIYGKPYFSLFSGLKFQIENKKLFENDEKVTYEGASIIEEHLIVFYSLTKDKVNEIYMQEFNDKIQPIGNKSKLGSYVFKGVGVFSKSFFEVIPSDNKKFTAVVWELYNNQEKSKTLFYNVLDSKLEIINTGSYLIPIDIEFSKVYSHVLSNTGDYFASIIEYNNSSSAAMAKTLLFKTSIERTIKEVQILHLINSEINIEKLSLKGKFVKEFKMKANGSDLVTITGSYGLDKKGINGLFFMRYNFKNKEINDTKFVEFSFDFLTEGMSDKMKAKMTQKVEEGKKELDLDDFFIKDLVILKDGSILGAYEQCKSTTTTSSGSTINSNALNTINRSGHIDATPTTTTTNMFYNNDVILFKINDSGDFDWIKKVEKRQKSSEGEGHHVSISAFVDNGNYYILFIDNKKNYDEQGRFINDSKIKSNPALLKNSVISLVEVNINSGELNRKNFFKVWRCRCNFLS